jgi:hypothetical protein
MVSPVIKMPKWLHKDLEKYILILGKVWMDIKCVFQFVGGWTTFCTQVCWTIIPVSVYVCLSNCKKVFSMEGMHNFQKISFGTFVCEIQ